MLAILLSLGVYLVWFGMFGPQETVQDSALNTEETGQVAEEKGAEGGDGSTGVSSAGTQASESDSTSTDAEAQAEVPVDPAMKATVIEEPHGIELEHQEQGIIDGTAEDQGSWSAEVHSNNGSLRNIVLSDYSTAPGYNSIWGHGIGAVFGDPNQPDEWSPYSGGESEHTLLSSDGALVLAGCCGLGDDGAGNLETAGTYEVAQDGAEVVATSLTEEGLHITKRYSKGADPYTINVTVVFENRSDRSMENLWVGVADQMSGDAGRFLTAVRPNAYVDGSVENIYDLDDLEGDEVETLDDGEVAWFGIGDRYFMGVLIPDESDAGKLIVDTLPGGRTGAFMVYSESLNSDEQRTLTFTAYIGPKSLDILEPMGEELEAAVEFGWFGVFSKPLLWLLKSCHSLVGNWGLAIIMLTFLIKLLFFRLTQKTYESSQRMQVIQPELKEIREKYKDNRELQTQETMNLFKEHNVNPMGSCLPMLLQLPVWFALYNTMLYSVELYNTSFLIFDDLTAPDPYGILPTLYVLLMVGQQRMMPMASMDPTQRKVMKMMPLIFGFFMYTFPSGLVLYFCVNMALTIFQQWIIKKNLKPLPTAEPAS